MQSLYKEILDSISNKCKTMHPISSLPIYSITVNDIIIDPEPLTDSQSTEDSESITVLSCPTTTVAPSTSSYPYPATDYQYPSTTHNYGSAGYRYPETTYDPFATGYRYPSTTHNYGSAGYRYPETTYDPFATDHRYRYRYPSTTCSYSGQYMDDDAPSTTHPEPYEGSLTDVISTIYSTAYSYIPSMDIIRGYLCLPTADDPDDFSLPLGRCVDQNPDRAPYQSVPCRQCADFVKYRSP
jgi:hypothetical protein